MPNTIATRGFRHGLLAGAAMGALLLMPGVAMAQSQVSAAADGATPVSASDQTNATGDEAAGRGVGDVVVTARNRAERLQDVPLAITALTGEQLQRTGVRNLREISYLTPGLTINSAGGEAYTQPIIRGLTNLNGGASDPNVAVFLDGVYVVNNSAISLGLIDIDRIEVVKGPVSSLYGHNGFAGAINYVTHRPGDTFTGSGAFTTGNDDQILATGSVSGPLIPGVLSLGLAGGYERNNGGYRDAVNGLRAGGYKKRDFRASFALTPTTGVTLSGGLYYGDDHFDTVALVYALDNCGALNPGSAALGEVTFTQYCGKLRFRPLEVSPVKPAAGAAGNDREVYSGNLRLEADLGLGTLSIIGGYNKVTQQRFEDFIGRRTNLIFNVTPAAPPPAQVSAAELFGGDSNNEDHSIEARFSSRQDRPLRVSFGGYYYKNKFTTSTLIGIDSSPLPAGKSFSGTAGLFATPAGQFSKSNLTLVNGTDEQTSGFATADLDLLQHLTLNSEFRYTHQAKTQDVLRNAFATNVIRPNGPAIGASDNFINYRVSAKYQVTQEAMLYGNVATGTKAFGFNSRATFKVPDELSFRPEYATAYEIGAKTNLLNRTLQLNVAAFLIDTRNLQAQVPSRDTTNTGLVTQNLGATREKGFEIEALVTPAPWLRFNLGVGYVDARFRGGAADFGSAGSCAAIPTCAARIRTTQDVNGVTRSFVLLDGLQVQRVSPWQVSTGLELTGHFSSELSWFTRGDLRIEDSQYTAATNYNFQPDRTVINLRAGLNYANIRAEVFVDNLTKNMTVESASANTRLNDFVANPVGFLPTPRRYGVTVGYSF